MYVDNNHNEKGAIRCLATGCDHLFTDQNSKDAQVTHYTQREVDTSLSDICRNEHGLLKQMHTLKRCLICQGDHVYYDIRTFFEHFIKDHPREKDVSTVHWFLVYVRKHSAGFPWEMTRTEDFRQEIYKLSYEHLALKLKKSTIWPHFNDFMGYRGGEIPEDKLRQSLTAPSPFMDYGPVDAPDLLSRQQYARGYHDLSKDECHELRNKVRDIYAKGEF